VTGAGAYAGQIDSQNLDGPPTLPGSIWERSPPGESRD
jgi:hypothetical protein